MDYGINYRLEDTYFLILDVIVSFHVSEAL